MFTIDSLDPVPDSRRGGFLAIGNYDGVHRGHAHLIGRLRAKADAQSAPAIALTFDPHPAVVLRPEAAPVPLSWTARTAALLLDAGATDVGIFRTGPWLLGLTAREFFDRIILGSFAARGLVEGPTFGFGRDRGGDAKLLGSWCAESGLDFEVIPPTIVDGEIVSSTRIRQALSAGQVELAARLLGRPHRIRGVVARGAGRGAGLGFPTANLSGVDTQIPADGVYAARAWVRGLPPWPSAVHVGPNLTFGEQARSVEVHLIDLDANLYERSLEVEFLSRLRGSMRFESATDLVEQIRRDVEQTRRLFEESSPRAGSVSLESG